LLPGLRLVLAVTAAAAGVTAASTWVASAGKAGSVFAATIMAGIAYDSMRIMRLVGVEMVERRFPVRWIWAMVAVTRIVAIVDMPIKPARAVKPGSSPDEHPAHEPIWPIVPIGCTVIGREVKVAIGADRRHPDVDGYLRRRTGKTAQHGRSEKRINNSFPMTHQLLLQIPPIGSQFEAKGCARLQKLCLDWPKDSPYRVCVVA
jgi:hypothetical protein